MCEQGGKWQTHCRPACISGAALRQAAMAARHSKILRPLSSASGLTPPQVVRIDHCGDSRQQQAQLGIGGKQSHVPVAWKGSWHAV